MSNFSQALQIAQRWPGDKAVPARLRDLYDNNGEDPKVAMFVEALYAAATDDEDLELIAKHWGES